MKNKKICSRCNNKVDNSARFCPQCGAEFGETMYGKTPVAERYEQNNQFPMKWYKWAKDLLVLDAISYVIYALIYSTGIIYGSKYMIDVLYMTYSGLKALNFSYAVSLIGLACFGIYTRSCLAKYKSNGPLCLYITYGVRPVISLLYGIASVIIIGPEVISAFFVEQLFVVIICGIVLIALNYIYFNKRKALFVN